MRDICSNAALVISWLSPAAGDSHLALQKLQKLSQRLSNLREFNTTMSELKLWGPILHDLLELSKNDPIQWPRISEDMAWRFSPGYNNCFIKAKLLHPSLDKARLSISLR